MTQLAAQTLGVPRERVELVNADTATTPDSGIQGASRATYFIGNSVCNATQNLTQHIFGAASELLDHHPADLRLAPIALWFGAIRPGRSRSQRSRRNWSAWANRAR
jgi:CO/xanthine dehydrogenase Mo-binding subunit